ncbi:MAG TPA: aromatic ring-hydroxylating dioxygenase subunit alpha, partial [Hyphomicrobiaceae bacterium]|nr:aromatic ring-hydroxylating dioxygenase subunit alpha [Hyphomicrobiaceae bacterium]
RDAEGKLGGFLNSCRHRGAVVCHTERGNAKFHVCHYHGWVYDSGGRNVDVKDRKQGCYAPAFDTQDHDLMRLARFAEYRGFLFGSLNAEVPSLEEHLGDARRFIDLVVDQSPHGVELVPGRSTYVYKGNWKLQIENCTDGYHLTSTHRSFISIVDRRNAGDSRHRLKVFDMRGLGRPDVVRGTFNFRNGHVTTWGTNPTPEAQPLYALVDELRQRVGERTTEWMLQYRNLTIYPNLQVAANASLQLRVIRPLSVDRTEMRIYCLAPIGEPESAREYRLRQFEDFFNATGLATPDDNVCYEDCQSGDLARGDGWLQGYARGIAATRNGPDEHASELGVRPEQTVAGPFNIANEVVFHAAYREWVRLMRKGFERKGRQGPPQAAASPGRPQ